MPAKNQDSTEEFLKSQMRIETEEEKQLIEKFKELAGEEKTADLLDQFDILIEEFKNK